MSEEFDANIVVADASGNRLANNDDGGGNCNALVTYVLPQAANYRVYAHSNAPAELGEDHLSLARDNSPPAAARTSRSEAHTSELQSLRHLVCRLLLAKKKDE